MISGSTIGAIVGACIAGLWGIAGAVALSGRSRAFAALLSCAVSAGIVMGLLHHAPRAAVGVFHGGIYGIAVTAEGMGIAVAIPLLKRLNRPHLLMPAISFLVGLHFLGLWQATGLIRFVLVAVGICLVAAWGALLAAPRRSMKASTVQAVVAFGTALVLWAAAFFSMVF